MPDSTARISARLKISAQTAIAPEHAVGGDHEGNDQHHADDRGFLAGLNAVGTQARPTVRSSRKVSFAGSAPARSRSAKSFAS